MPSSAIPEAAKSPEPNVVLEWNEVALTAVRGSHLGAPIVARVFAIMHTCMYDAWAAYDDKAAGTQLASVLRRPLEERTLNSKSVAVSYAAYVALDDLLPSEAGRLYKPLMLRLGLDPNLRNPDLFTPSGIGVTACEAVLTYRHNDFSNQLGDLSDGSYSDWTGYSPANPPVGVTRGQVPPSVTHWQPLAYFNGDGNAEVQRFLVPHWGRVVPFALSNGDELRSSITPAAAGFGTKEFAEDVNTAVAISSGLTDRQKMIAEYWDDGPYSAQAPGHWISLASLFSQQRHNTLDEDVCLFFILSNALLDTSIAAWDAKRAVDSPRPATAVPLMMSHSRIKAWGGPGKGTIEMDGADWSPYQSSRSPTPPFPDYVSAHSAFSAAAATILTLWYRNDKFGMGVSFASGSSTIEPGITPKTAVMLKWNTFSDAADEAGLSRQLGGLHFGRADAAGRCLGKLVAHRTWNHAEDYLVGREIPLRLFTSPHPLIADAHR